MGEVRQREPSIEIPVLRELAHGAPCQFRIPGVCKGRDETSCWCHSNDSRHGKGVGKKSHDLFGAIGCVDCHTYYDTEGKRAFCAPLSHDVREELRAIFEDARDRSMIWLYRNGHLKFIK